MSVQENIKSRNLADLLLSIARDGESGILTVQGHDEIIALSFLEGRVVSADALNQPLEDGLGQILADESMVSPEDFAALAGEYQAGGGRVVDLLVERRFVTQEQLFDVLRLHYYQLCQQVLDWDDGEFKFYKGDEISYEEGVEELSVEEVMVRTSSESTADSNQFQHMPSAETIFERTDQNLPDSEPASALAELVGPGLPSKDPGREALSLLERIDGKRSAETLARDSGLETYAGLFTLYRLQEAEFIRCVLPAIQTGGSAAAAGLSEDRTEEGPKLREVAASTTKSLPGEALPQRAVLWGTDSHLDGLDGGSVESGIGPLIEEVSVPSRRARASQRPKGWLAEQISGLLAVGLAGFVIFVATTSPGRFLTPLDQQEKLRAEMENDLQASVYLKIDRAAKTFFLLDGLFPVDLESLVERRLLAESDIRLDGGETLLYSASPAGYRISRLTRRDGDVGDLVFAETIDGNFLLDPEFVIRDDRDLPPLVLLD